MKFLHFCFYNLSLALTFIISFALSSFSASANNSLVNCSYCSSQAEFEYVVRSQSLVEGTSYVYVSNIDSGVLTKYYRKYVPGDAQYGEPATIVIKPVAVDSTSATNFNRAVQQRSEIANLLDTIKEVPDHVARSAWQLGANPVFRQDVAKYYRDNQSLRQLVGNYTATLATLGGKLGGFTLYVTVSFTDGSMARYQIVGIDENGQLEFAFLSAQDNLGNNVPTSISQLEGYFRLDGKGWASYGSIAVEFGIVARFDGELPTGHAEIIDCHSETGADGKMKIVCKKSNKP